MVFILSGHLLHVHYDIILFFQSTKPSRSGIRNKPAGCSSRSTGRCSFRVVGWYSLINRIRRHPLTFSTRYTSRHRWGSEEAFEAEMARRKSKAESSYEARKRAYDQRATASTSSALPGQVAPNNDAQSPGDRLPYPSRPRILDLGNAKNYVGVNQQKHNRIRGEKYGFFTVVNEAFFDSGPKASVATRTVQTARGCVALSTRVVPYRGRCHRCWFFKDGCTQPDNV